MMVEEPIENKINIIKLLVETLIWISALAALAMVVWSISNWRLY